MPCNPDVTANAANQIWYTDSTVFYHNAPFNFCCLPKVEWACRFWWKENAHKKPQTPQPMMWCFFLGQVASHSKSRWISYGPNTNNITFGYDKKILKDFMPTLLEKVFFMDRIPLPIFMSQKKVTASQLLTYKPITKMCLHCNVKHKYKFSVL